MSPGEIAVLALIIGAFSGFAVALFWVSWTNGTPTLRREAPRKAGLGSAYPTDTTVAVDD